VAILDTGAQAGHPEFAGRMLPGANFSSDAGATAQDGHGHGTHVAGLVGAARDGVRMHGVAFGATLLPVKVLSDAGIGDSSMVDRGLSYAAAQGAFVANVSLVASGAYDPTALRSVIDGGMLIVAAAGNQGLAHPEWPARYASQSWARGQIIAVVAVDANNTIAWFSNRAGDARDYTLAAPGVLLESTALDGYVTRSGTSMAAPLVTGAAALVKSRWQYLTAAQVAEILFTTATDLGEPGTDAVYGRGLVNVERAMQPVGTVQTQTAGAGQQPVTGTLSGGALTSAISRAAADGRLKVAGLDAFGRDFSVDLGRQLRVRPLLAEELFAVVQPAAPDRDDTVRLERGSASALLPVAHLGLMHDATTLSARVPLVRGWSFAPSVAVQSDRASAAGISLAYATGPVSVGATLTRLSEHRTYLGATGSGLFSMGEAATRVLGLFASARVAPGRLASASVSFGTTPGTGSPLMSLSSTTSVAVKASLQQRDVLRMGDMVGVTIEQPMRIVSGAAQITRMTGVDADGAAVMSSDRIGLAGDGRELRIGLSYRVPLSRTTAVQLAAVHRRQPGHVASAPAENAFALRYQARF